MDSFCDPEHVSQLRSFFSREFLVEFLGRLGFICLGTLLYRAVKTLTPFPDPRCRTSKVLSGFSDLRDSYLFVKCLSLLRFVGNSVAKRDDGFSDTGVGPKLSDLVLVVRESGASGIGVPDRAPHTKRPLGLLRGNKGRRSF